MDRNPYEKWLTLGRPELYAKARKKVQEILATPEPNPLPGDVVAKLDDIMRRADAELAP